MQRRSLHAVVVNPSSLWIFLQLLKAISFLLYLILGFLSPSCISFGVLSHSFLAIPPSSFAFSGHCSRACGNWLRSDGLWDAWPGWAAMRHAESVSVFASPCFDEPDRWHQGERLNYKLRVDASFGTCANECSYVKSWRVGERDLCSKKNWKTLCVAAGQFNASPVESLTFDYIQYHWKLQLKHVDDCWWHIFMP